MPNTKIPEVRAEIILKWMKGKTIKALASEYNVTDRAISADKKTYAHIWKKKAVEFLCRELLKGLDQREFVNRHLNLYAVTDKEYLDFIEQARFDVQRLETLLKRVGTLFKAKGEVQ